MYISCAWIIWGCKRHLYTWTDWNKRVCNSSARYHWVTLYTAQLSSNNSLLCNSVLFMCPYVAHSICFSLRYDLTGKDIVSMATALLLAHPPSYTRHRRKWNMSNFCWLVKKQLCDTHLHTDVSPHSSLECLFVCLFNVYDTVCLWVCFGLSIQLIISLFVLWNGNINLKRKLLFVVTQLKGGYFVCAQWPWVTLYLSLWGYLGWGGLMLVLKLVPWSRTMAGILPTETGLSPPVSPSNRVIVSALSICYLFGLLVGLLKHYQTDVHKTWPEDWL